MAIIVIRSEEHSANDPEIRDDRRFEGVGAIDEAVQFLVSLKNGTAPAQPTVPQEPAFIPTPVIEPEPLPVVTGNVAPAGDTSALEAALGETPAPAGETIPPAGETLEPIDHTTELEDETGKDENETVDQEPAAAQPSELEQLLGDQASS